MIAPRYAWAPPRVRSLGKECVEHWRAAGGTLYEWQAFVIEQMLGLDELDRWVSADDGLNVARQNGKGVILQAIEAYFAFELGYPVVLHTAHEFPTSREHQLRLEATIQDGPLHQLVKPRGGYVHANGQESIRLKSGGRIVFKARTKGGGRGYSGDLLVWDEAMVVPDSVVAAQKPTLRASRTGHGPKVIWAGSAVDQETHEYGVNFARLRERGMAQAERVSWHEWSAPFESLADLDESALEVREHWLAANPSMPEGLIAESTMADEIGLMPMRAAAVELLGVGDWPRTDGRDDTVISIGDWDALEQGRSRLQVEEWWALAFDVSPERRTSIAAAGFNQEGRFHVEIHEARPGTGWLVERLAAMYEKGLPDVVVCDGVGPAASLVPALEEAGVPVETVSTPEHGAACGRLVDMVSERTLVHLGSSELRDAVRGAKSRPIGDVWLWSRRNSDVDISPLVAATLALGACAGVTAGEVAIL